MADAPFYIAIEKGYFAAEKLDVSLERFTSAAQATAPLSTNQVQVVGGGVGAALYNAVRARLAGAHRHGAHARLARLFQRHADAAQRPQGHRHLGQGPQGQDGRHQRAGLGAAFHAGRGSWRPTASRIADVQTINMAWPNMAPGMETKAIDGGMVVEPFAAQFAQKNIAFPFRRAADFMKKPPLEVSVILYSKAWMDKQPDQAKAFTVAYLKGVRDYFDAMKGGPKRAEVVEICVKYTSLKDKAMYDKIQWSYMDPNAEISFDGLRDQQDWYAKQGFVRSKANIESMIDRRFLDYALEKLGRVDDK